jgi:4'-phosphopantetheinyl transferase
LYSLNVVTFSLSTSAPAFVATTLEVPYARTARVEVLCVAINFRATLNAPAFAVLDDDERTHAARFLRREDALRHAAARAALREALGKRLGMPASALRFERDGLGRPRLAKLGKVTTDTEIDFNLSHSGRFALIAIATGRRVGIDIEACRPTFDWRALSESVFSPSERAYVASLPESLRRSAFYDVWTAKEAFLKALGIGLAGGMLRFSVVGRASGVSAPAFHMAAGEPHMDGITAFEAAWCRVPTGYAACVAWSRERFCRAAR